MTQTKRLEPSYLPYSMSSCSGLLPKLSSKTTRSTWRAKAVAGSGSAQTYTPNGSVALGSMTSVTCCRIASWRAASMSEPCSDDLIGVEEVAGELDGSHRIESFAGVDVGTEEHQRLIPRVEVGARGLPVDPAGPAV